MFKLLLLLAGAIPAFLAEDPSAFSLLEKQGLPAKESKPEHYPAYRGVEHHQGRANIEPARARGPVIKYDSMLADQPISKEENGHRDNKVDDLTILGYGFVPVPQELAYTDIPYAPGYSYDLMTEYAALNKLLSAMKIHLLGIQQYFSPSTRLFHNCWRLFLHQLLYHYIQRRWTYSRRVDKLDVSWTLEKIGNIVKTAIDKYHTIQKVTDVNKARRRRALFN